MNEVATSFWNNENRFWVITEPSTSNSYIAFLDIELCCECAELSIENHISLEVSSEDMINHLTSNTEITIWNLETDGRTTMTKRGD